MGCELLSPNLSIVFHSLIARKVPKKIEKLYRAELIVSQSTKV